MSHCLKNVKSQRMKVSLVSGEMSSQVRLRLLPSARCLFDEPIQVKVAGLRSRQVVSMKARSTDEKGVVFSSSATYRADGSGEIDLKRDPSLSGSYVGVEPMGLLWSMRADTLHKYFFKNNSLNPHVVKFSVHEGEERMLAEVNNERLLIGDGVSRLPVKEGNMRGVLFTPPGEGPFPAVLDLSTFPSEKRASLLANKGFVVLAVAVYTDKPDNVKELHLDHFKEAVDFLQQHPKGGVVGCTTGRFSPTAGNLLLTHLSPVIRTGFYTLPSSQFLAELLSLVLFLENPALLSCCSVTEDGWRFPIANSLLCQPYLTALPGLALTCHATPHQRNLTPSIKPISPYLVKLCENPPEPCSCLHLGSEP
ncbi:acyl-coenzyme A thioesterase 1-like isoform X5 [Micropterus salmoides]|uniref:acyl-coenzyme A thioesterase 1-like isoform X5 n=1 Tax=Micropterus salmoides TaxID=27706 RepID=UPI0018ED526B|nr:acyl-coenzyme A thioesterase 1-like isoform X5 [Micropterus salmoides]